LNTGNAKIVNAEKAKFGAVVLQLIKIKVATHKTISSNVIK